MPWKQRNFYGDLVHLNKGDVCNLNKYIAIGILALIMFFSMGFQTVEAIKEIPEQEIAFNSPDTGQRDRDRTNVFGGLIKNYEDGFGKYLGYAIGAALIILISWIVIELINWIRKAINKNKHP
jgi:hypothetical protein